MHLPLRSHFGFVATTILLAAFSGLDAAELRERPAGMAAGPLIFRPYLLFGYDYNTNVFYLPENVSQGGDWERRLAPGVAMNLPFRNSTFDVNLQARHDSYRETELDRKLSLFADLRLDLAFASSDHLELTVAGARGIAETTNLDRGGEFFFRGQPYDQRNIGVALARREFGKRGYVVQVQPSAITYDPNVVNDLDQSRFYQDYRGYSAGIEYREPVSPVHWFTAALQADRFDYYCRDREAYPDTCAVGRSYRGESGDLLWLGVSGVLSNDQPYSARLGWASFRYRHDLLQDYLDEKEDFESDYRGLVGSINASFRVARPLQLIVVASQRPWSSIDDKNNYFLQRLGVLVVNLSARKTDSYGASLSLSRVTYPLPSFGVDHRRDDTIRAELYANVTLRDLVKLRLSISRQRRDSNVVADPDLGYPELDYDGKIYSVGLVFGWDDR